MQVRKITALAFLFLAVAFFAKAENASAQTVNLINNPSAETIGTPRTKPENWSFNKWGNLNAVFSYPTAGAQDGVKSLQVTVTKYQDGDAKWFFDPVEVLPSSNYLFKHYYKSSVSTRIVVMSLDLAGNPTYFEVDPNVPAFNTPALSTTWKEYSVNIQTLPNTKSLTVFHLIENRGFLRIDNASLEYLPPVSQSTIVPNPSVENVNAIDSSLPESWSHHNWGSNTPTYEYLNNGGHDGSRSVKVTVSNYVSGDAAWVFTPQNFTQGSDYEFNVWYKTNTIPHVVARYERADGSEYFFGMSDPQPSGTASTDWQKYTGTFSVPADAVKASAYMFISNDGWVETDSYSITPYTYVGFNRGLVSLVFDDGYEENITTALPVIESFGWRSTQCSATQFVEGDANQIAKIQAMATAGHEICSHTVTHPDLRTLSNSDLVYEITHAKNFLQSITGQTIENFASPFGKYNASVNSTLALYQNSHRTTDEGYNSKDNFNRYALKVQNMQQTTTLAEFQSWVNKSIADKTWLILVYHVVSNTPTTQFDTIQSDFNSQMNWLSTSGAVVKTWGDAFAEVFPQI